MHLSKASAGGSGAMKSYIDKIDPKQLRMLLFVFMLLILFCSYQFGYVSLKDKTTAIEQENQGLEQRYEELSAQVAMEGEYDRQVVACSTQIKDILEQYGAGNTPEKSTKFLIDLCEATGMEIPTVSFSYDEEFFSSTTVPSTDGLGVYAYRNLLTINFKSTYQAFKDCMTYINQYPEKMNVSSISVNFDTDTGNLSGVLAINQYSMIGNGKTYEEPDLGEIPLGTKSVFGTITLPEDTME